MAIIDLATIYTTIAIPADIPALVTHINSGYRGDASRQGWTTEADILGGIRIDAPGVQDIIDEPNADLHLFRQANEELIACVYLKLNPDHLYLGMLTVRPDLQAAGIGKFILRYAEDLALRQNKNLVRMTVINVRTELIAWYNRHGYLPTGETEPWNDTLHIGTRKAEFYFVVLEKDLAERPNQNI